MSANKTPKTPEVAGTASAPASMIPLSILPDLSNIPEKDIEKASREIAGRHGAIETTETRGAENIQTPRPKSPVSNEIQMPLDDEEVEWLGKFRAEIPIYVMEQVYEYAHKKRCTVAHVLLNMMRGFQDENGPVFFIRKKDCLVADRRKAKKQR